MPQDHQTTTRHHLANAQRSCGLAKLLSARKSLIVRVPPSVVRPGVRVRITLRWRQSISPKTSAENDVTPPPSSLPSLPLRVRPRPTNAREGPPSHSRAKVREDKISYFEKACLLSSSLSRQDPFRFSLGEECRTGKSDKMEIRCRGDLHLPLPVRAKNENGLPHALARRGRHGCAIPLLYSGLLFVDRMPWWTGPPSRPNRLESVESTHTHSIHAGLSAAVQTNVLRV